MPGLEEQAAEKTEKASDSEPGISHKTETISASEPQNSVLALKNRTFPVIGPPVLTEPQPRRWIGPENGEVHGSIEGPDGVVFLVSKGKVVVGRESSHNQADIVIRENSFVSRGHLVMVLGEDKVWRLSCHGKNGVFVGDKLVKKGADPAEILEQCVLRFPSTMIRLLFCPRWSESGKLTNPTSKDSIFVSPIVVGNNNNFIGCGSSCPASPRGPVRPLSTASSVDKATPEPSDAILDNDFDSGESGEEREGKPPYSYAQLIVQAISSQVDKQLTLSGIYAYITKNYPYYRTCDKGWQNSIRHNLSLNRYFIKIPRNQEEPGKGSFWRLDPVSEMKLMHTAFRKRRQRGSTPAGKPNQEAKLIRSAPTSPSVCDGNIETSSAAGILNRPQTVDVKHLTEGNRPETKLLMSLSAAGNTVTAPNSNLNCTTGTVSRVHSNLGTTVHLMTNHNNADTKAAALATPRQNHVSIGGYPVGTEKQGSSVIIERNGIKMTSPDQNQTIKREISSESGSKQRVFRFSPVMTEEENRISQSAPCSPKNFGRHSAMLEQCIKEGQRDHHHSGGTFCVRTNTNDGRQRLQLCHSPPEFVSVTKAETSALQAITEESRSRRSSGSLLQRYRGGSKSLSTTPVREILASGGPKMYGRTLEAEGIVKALSQASPEPKVLKRRKPSPTILEGVGAHLHPSSSTLANRHQAAAIAAGLLPPNFTHSTSNGNVIFATRPSAPVDLTLGAAGHPGNSILYSTASLLTPGGFNALNSAAGVNFAALNSTTALLQAAAAQGHAQGSAQAAAAAYLAAAGLGPPPPKVARSD